ncbi:MAG: hypothetical protein M1826_005594 [Phylliscum demangeonii]|nr:MAG: hypothetical protein M1826_005594 [Phylliscum demangeonii]
MLNVRSLVAGLTLAGWIGQAAAHGYVHGIYMDNEAYTGTIPGEDRKPDRIGWFIAPGTDNGFAGTGYDDPDFICNKQATPGTAYGNVTAGDTIVMDWGSWNPNHQGPIINYLASCNGSCFDADKTKMKFVKISEAGLIGTPGGPEGLWAVDKFILDNSTWSIKIPQHIKPGNYMLRHEIIALQVAYAMPGAQHYPQCGNLKISGEGTDEPVGTPWNELYRMDDPGIHIDIRLPVTNYTIPGPPVYVDGSLSNAASAASAGSSPEPTMSTVSSVADVASTSSAPSYDSPTPVASPAAPETTTATDVSSASYVAQATDVSSASPVPQATDVSSSTPVSQYIDVPLASPVPPPTPVDAAYVAPESVSNSTPPPSSTSHHRWSPHRGGYRRVHHTTRSIHAQPTKNPAGSYHYY